MDYSLMDYDHILSLKNLGFPWSSPFIPAPLPARPGEKLRICLPICRKAASPVARSNSRAFSPGQAKGWRMEAYHEDTMGIFGDFIGNSEEPLKRPFYRLMIV